jgi:RHS repeat-associated protein
MQMFGRTYSSSLYRYGFNGKEMDNEVSGSGNQYDYGNRIYEPRLGRFTSVDPLQKKFAALSPYQFSGDNPIATVDLDGLEPAAINKGTQALVIILQGFGGDPPDNNTQASNAAKSKSGLRPDEALGSIVSTGTKLQVVIYASSQSNNTKTDVLSSIKNFRSVNPDGKVILIGHSGGADNIVELAKENKDVKINLMITLDVRDPKKLGWTDTNIPSNVENAINYYQNTDKLNLISNRKMDFSSETNGVNILSPGSNHRSIDNDQVQNVIEDINNELLNRNPVENAKNRIQPVHDPKKSNSDPIPHVPLVSH